MKDIAKHANVSVATVARVVRGIGAVSPEVSERVKKSLHDMRYVPTQRSPVRKRRLSHTFAFVVPDISNPFFPLLLKGVAGVARINQKDLVVCSSENKYEIEQWHLESLVDREIEGIVFVPISDRSASLEVLQKGVVPIVLLDRELDNLNLSSVVSDNVEGAYQAVKYLLKMGHRDIAFLAYKRETSISTERARFAGYKRALAEFRVDVRDELIVCGSFELNQSYDEVSKRLSGGITFTAVFSANDYMAYGAIRAFKENKIRVPEDVSVVGYDDLPFSSVISLTTVSQPWEEMGRDSVTMLLDLVAKKRESSHRIVLKPSMVIRDSCKRLDRLPEEGGWRSSVD